MVRQLAAAFRARHAGSRRLGEARMASNAATLECRGAAATPRPML